MLRIMIIDDEKYVRNSLKSKIDWNNLPITLCGEAGDGEEALEKIQHILPDLVLCDMSMEGMDGIALTNILQRDYPKIAIIVISGYDNFEYTRSAIKNRAWDYLLKPVDPNELNNTLFKCCQSLIKFKKEQIVHTKLQHEKALQQCRSQIYILNRLIFDFVSAEESKLLAFEFMNLSKAEKKFSYYCAAVLHIENIKELLREVFFSEPLELVAAISDFLTTRFFSVWLTMNLEQPSEWILILGFLDHPSHKDLEKSLRKCILELTAKYSLICAAAFGEPQSKLYNLSMSYRQAIYQLNRTSYSAVQKAVQYINQHYSEKITLEQLSSYFFINKIYFSKIFKKGTGKTFLQYLTEIRMSKAHSLIHEGSMMIKDIAASVGYDDYRYFNRIYKKYYGISPSQDRVGDNNEY